MKCDVCTKRESTESCAVCPCNLCASCAESALCPLCADVIIEWRHEGDESEIETLRDFLRANRDAESFCDDVRARITHEWQNFGGGASPVVQLRIIED